MKVERPGEADHHELEHYQDEAASHEVARQRTPVSDVQTVEVRSGPCQENESRGAEVRDPAGEENAGGRTARRNSGVHAHVIDGHHHPPDSAHDADRSEAIGAHVAAWSAGSMARRPHKRCDKYASGA